MKTLKEINLTNIFYVPENFTGKVVRTNGCVEYYKNGITHREDGPAIIIKRKHTIIEKYCKNGVFHREDGPAIIEYKKNSALFYFVKYILYFLKILKTPPKKCEIYFEDCYFNGRLHNATGPTTIDYIHNDKQYIVHDKLHREDGLPAIEYGNGNKEYYVNNKRHRIGGPAIEYADGSYKGYYINGKQVSKEAHDLLVLFMELKERNIS